MGIKKSLEKSLTKFGKNNSPTIVAMGIATAKGIFRPTFTMMDKKEKLETKRYTAIREGLTELIAIPVYFLSGVASKYVTKKLAVPKNFMKKDIYKKYKAGDVSEEVKNAVKHAEDLAKINVSKIASTSAFIGVCLSALLIIPMVCSATIKPIMKVIEKRNMNKNQKPESVPKTDINNAFKGHQLNTFKSVCPSNYGMKVGAL